MNMNITDTMRDFEAEMSHTVFFLRFFTTSNVIYFFDNITITVAEDDLEGMLLYKFPKSSAISANTEIMMFSQVLSTDISYIFVNEDLYAATLVTIRVYRFV